MKKAVSTLLVFFFLFSLCSCSDTDRCKDAVLEYGTSEIYSEKEIDGAFRAVMDDFNTWDAKCTMISLAYAGDDVTRKCSKYQSESDDNAYDEFIVVEGSFRTPKHNAGGFDRNTVIDDGWTWELGRNNGGEWKIITYGYC